jgi:hypothetical protein
MPVLEPIDPIKFYQCWVDIVDIKGIIKIIMAMAFSTSALE